METEYPIRPPPPKPLDVLKLKYGGASPEYASRQSWVTVNHLLRVRRCKSYFWHKMEKSEYHREYNLNRYHERRKEFKDHLGGKCVDCGSTESLEFDHIDRSTKTLELGKILNVSKEKALEELKLCQLLCTKCHIEKSKKDGSFGTVGHGEGVSGKRNCKCDLCRNRKNEYMRNWKRERRKKKLASMV